MTATVAELNAKVFRDHGIGGWRELYLSFLRRLEPASIIDFGCGSPHFLTLLPGIQRRIGLDGSAEFAEAYRNVSVEFYQLDFDHDELPLIDPVQVAICSDVFEHLLFPERTLTKIRHVLTDDGVLFSHVPNEFTLRKTLRVMLGRETAIYSHPQCSEFDHPHVHRFTKIGYLNFLEREFRHNLYISDLRYGRAARCFKRLGLTVPYALEMGPTFISTNCEVKLEALIQLKTGVAAL